MRDCVKRTRFEVLLRSREEMVMVPFALLTVPNCDQSGKWLVGSARSRIMTNTKNAFRIFG